MLNLAKIKRDPFTLSLGGMTTVASFAFAPAIADNRICKIRNGKRDQGHADQTQSRHSWQGGQAQDAQTSCA